MAPILRGRKLFFVSLAVFTAAVFMLFCLGCNGEKYSLFQPQPRVLPIADEYALQQYDYSELEDVRTTLRADTMHVTRRGLKRAETKLLSDVFTLRASTQSGASYSESIEFTKYPSPSAAIKPTDFTEAAYTYGKAHGINVDTAAGQLDALNKYFYYYKYMLLSQNFSLLEQVSAMSAAGTLTQENLYKHPAADSQYGEVIGTDNAVEKVMILDPVYRANHVTGLYLPAGEAVKVRVEGMKSGEKLQLVVALNGPLAWRGAINSDNVKEALTQLNAETESAAGDFFTCADIVAAGGKFYDTYEVNEKGETVSPLVSAQWKRQNNRMPRLNVTFTFSANGEYTVGSPMGGIMHVSPSNCYSPAQLTFTGAVETPHYILGVTTPEYFDTYLRNPETAPGVYSALDTENGQLVGLASYMRKVKTEEIQKLALLWHSFFAVNESYTGGTYNRNNLVRFDQHVPAGAAVALGGMVYACPTDWYGGAMNYRGLLNGGTWGILHEVGHSHGSAYGTVWGMKGNQEGEVRNNALIVLSYLKFCDIGTTRNADGGIPAEHGFVAHPYSNLKKTMGIAAANPTDFNNLDYFNALSIYVNIMHSFGPDKFYELMYSYKTNPSYNFIGESGVSVGNNRSDFIYRLATVYGMDFREYANETYKANAGGALFSEEQRAFMDALPVYRPVANFYAGGIDGVKTGGDYKIAYGRNVEFDLKSKTITTADGFEILSVSQPVHGKLTPLGDDRYAYEFDSDYAGASDSFTFDVKLSDGVCHRFTVYLRLSYNGATVENYGAVTSGDLDAAEAEAFSRAAVSVETQSFAGVQNYKSETKYEVRSSQFYYRAERDGEHTFSARADDKAKVYFGESFDTLQASLSVQQYTAGFSDANSFTVSLQKGKLYAFRLVNCNTGGQGGAALGLKKAAGGYDVLNAGRIYPKSLHTIDKVEEYVFEPKFMVSKKDNVLSSVMTTDKSDWSVVSAPTDIAGGRYVSEELKDVETGKVIGTITTDKWSYLIDGKTGTTFHTVWGKGATPATEENPDVFVIDTNKVQSFNFFKITAPNRSDYCVKKYDLQISDDNNVYRSISSSDKLEYKSGVANVKFPQATGRFLKLIVKQTSGDNNGSYTVISELEAGITSSTQLIFPSDSEKYFFTSGWERAACDSLTRSGLMTSVKKNAKLVIKFKGESISLYSDVAPGYGGAKIKLDGKAVAEVSLHSSETKNRQLIFYQEGLKNKEHTVEIITSSSAPFNLDFVGASYNAHLVNASNVYLEKGLVIALIVFILLFALVTAALCVVLFVPSVRKKLLVERQPKPKKQKPIKPQKTKPAVRSKPAKAKTPVAKGAAKTANRAAAPVYDGDYEDFVEEVPIGDLFQTTSFYQEEQRRKSAAVQPGVFTANAASIAAAEETAAAKTTAPKSASVSRGTAAVKSAPKSSAKTPAVSAQSNQQASSDAQSKQSTAAGKSAKSAASKTTAVSAAKSSTAKSSSAKKPRK